MQNNISIRYYIAFILSDYTGHDLFCPSTETEVFYAGINAVIPEKHEVTKVGLFGRPREILIIQLYSATIFVEQIGDQYFDVISHMEIQNGEDREVGDINDIAFSKVLEVDKGVVEGQKKRIRKCLNPSEANDIYCQKLQRIREVSMEAYARKQGEKGTDHKRLSFVRKDANKNDLGKK